MYIYFFITEINSYYTYTKYNITRLIILLLYFVFAEVKFDVKSVNYFDVVINNTFVFSAVLF